MAPEPSCSFCRLSWWSPRTSASVTVPSSTITIVLICRSAGAPPSAVSRAAMVRTPGVGNRTGPSLWSPSLSSLSPLLSSLSPLLSSLSPLLSSLSSP